MAKVLRNHALPEWQWTHIPAGEVRDRQGETLNDAQEEFQRWCIVHNVPHSVAYSFDEALAVLDASR